MATKWTDLPIPPGFNVIKEGTASVLVPNGNKVFYNEVQEFNRDLSILVISQFSANKMAQKHEKVEQWLAKRQAHSKGLHTGNSSDDDTLDISSNPVKKQKTSTSTSTSTSNSETAQTSQLPPTAPQSDAEIDALIPTLSCTTQQKACFRTDIPARLQYKGIRIFEALSASGLRSIRYFNEIPYVDTVHVNDMDTEAVESIRRNVIYNQLDLNKVIPNRNEATAALYANRAVTYDLVHNKVVVHEQSTLPAQPPEITDDHPLAFLYKPQHLDTKSLTTDYIPHLPLWNVVDLDPYGSAAPFLDAAIQAVEDDGLLCVTCTDGAILCGNYPETGFGKYNAIPLHALDISKEFGLRMLLHTIESTATKYGRHITPLLSFSIDFYMRVFVKVNTSQQNVKYSGTKQVMIAQCVNCRTFESQRCIDTTSELDPTIPVSQQKTKFTIPQNTFKDHCEICLSKVKLYGPVWGNAIHDRTFAQQCLESAQNRQYSSLRAQERLSATSAQDEPKDKSKVFKSTDIFTGLPKTLHLTTFPHVLCKFGTYRRLSGMLTMAVSELPTIMGFPLASFAQALNISTPPIQTFISALFNAGYLTSETHTAPNLIKTDAPNSFFIDFLKATVVLTNGCVGKDYDQLIKIPRKLLADAKITKSDGTELVFDDEIETEKYTKFTTAPENATFLEWVTKKDQVTKTYQPLDINPMAVKNNFVARWTAEYEVAEKLRQEAKAATGKTAREIKLLSSNTTTALWVLSQPMKHKINFTPKERSKIGIHFGNPTAYWGPKAMAGSFNVRGYTDLTTGSEASVEEATKNVSRALALAQQQRAIDNQGKHRKRKDAAAGVSEQQGEQQALAMSDNQ